MSFLHQMWQMIFKYNRKNSGYASVFFSLMLHFFLIRLFITSSSYTVITATVIQPTLELGKQ